MTRQVLKKWGNSPAVRIPAAVMQAAKLALNQHVEIKVEGGRVIVEPAAPPCALDDLLAGITPENRHEAVDFGGPQGREQL
ncbi:MAG: AbrB/MazE/SpoVT family DNA-binding domain-containing protein [Candidatus Competibacteraceae bacterium]